MREHELYDDYESEPRHVHKKKKINKNMFCRKNKIRGTLYGPHIYEEGKKVCKNCGHIKKEGINDIQPD